jgi:hypothetical protein
LKEEEMTARDHSLEDALLSVADGSAMSSDPEWKYVPVRRFATAADNTQGDYGGPDAYGGPDSYGETDTFGAEDILL